MFPLESSFSNEWGYLFPKGKSVSYTSKLGGWGCSVIRTYGPESRQPVAGSRPTEQIDKFPFQYTCAYLTLIMNPRSCEVQRSGSYVPHLKDSVKSGPYFNYSTNTSQHSCLCRSSCASAPLTLMGAFDGSRFSNPDGAALTTPRPRRREVAYKSFMMMRI